MWKLSPSLAVTVQTGAKGKCRWSDACTLPLLEPQWIHRDLSLYCQTGGLYVFLTETFSQSTQGPSHPIPYPVTCVLGSCSPHNHLRIFYTLGKHLWVCLNSTPTVHTWRWLSWLTLSSSGMDGRLNTGRWNSGRISLGLSLELPRVFTWE